jgi:hypothetical protein
MYCDFPMVEIQPQVMPQAKGTTANQIFILTRQFISKST